MAEDYTPDQRQPVTIRLPVRLVELLNQAATDEDRASTSDMIRVALEDWLAERGYLKLPKPPRKTSKKVKINHDN